MEFLCHSEGVLRTGKFFVTVRALAYISKPSRSDLPSYGAISASPLLVDRFKTMANRFFTVCYRFAKRV